MAAWGRINVANAATAGRLGGAWMAGCVMRRSALDRAPVFLNGELAAPPVLQNLGAPEGPFANPYPGRKLAAFDEIFECTGGNSQFAAHLCLLEQVF